MSTARLSRPADEVAALTERQVCLDLLHREIAACARCVEAGFIPGANPIFYGHAGLRLMIVGQAPGPTAGKRPVPFTGPSGRTLGAWLEQAEALVDEILAMPGHGAMREHYRG